MSQCVCARLHSTSVHLGSPPDAANDGCTMRLVGVSLRFGKGGGAMKAGTLVQLHAFSGMG